MPTVQTKSAGEPTVVMWDDVDMTVGIDPACCCEGACCYDDGTCDNLLESDCNDAGGNWQGADTSCEDDPNPCQGVCCEESGCVDGSNPDSCAGDGGTWTDFQTTCADDPPPCNPCDVCAFSGFIDPSVKFLTLTVTLTGYTDSFDTCSCTASGSVTNTCGEGCSCSGSMNRTGPGVCSETATMCGGSPFYPGDSTSGPFVKPLDFIGCPGTTACTNCVNFALSGSPSSNTSATYTIHPYTLGSASGTITYTLSGECTPTGGSPFSDPFFQNN